jgi:hypothetical protein
MIRPTIDPQIERAMDWHEARQLGAQRIAISN